MITNGLILNKQPAGDKKPLELLTAQMAQRMYGEGKLTDKLTTPAKLYKFFAAVGSKAAPLESRAQQVKALFLNDSGKLTEFAQYLIEKLSEASHAGMSEYLFNALQGTANQESWDRRGFVIQHAGSLTMLNQLGHLINLIASPTTDANKVKAVLSTITSLKWERKNCLGGSANIVNDFCIQLAPNQMVADAAKNLLYNLSKQPQLLTQIIEHDHAHIPTTIARSLGMPANIIDAVDTYVAFGPFPHIRAEFASKSEAIIASVFVSLIQQFNQLSVDLHALQPMIQAWQANQTRINNDEIELSAQHAKQTFELAQKINAIAGEHGNLLAKYIHNDDLAEIQPARLNLHLTQNAPAQYAAIKILADKQKIKIPALVMPIDARENFKQAYLEKFAEQEILKNQFSAHWENATSNASNASNAIEALKEFLKENAWHAQAQAFKKDELDFDVGAFFAQKCDVLEATLKQKPAPAKISIELAVDEVEQFEAEAQIFLAGSSIELDQASTNNHTSNHTNIIWPDQNFSKLICEYNIYGSPKKINFDKLLTAVARDMLEEFKTYDVTLAEPVLLHEVIKPSDTLEEMQQAIASTSASASQSPIQSQSKLPAGNLTQQARALSQLNAAQTLLLHQFLTLKGNAKQRLLNVLQEANNWQDVEQIINTFLEVKTRPYENTREANSRANLSAGNHLTEFLNLLFRTHKNAYHADHDTLVQVFYPKYLQIINASDAAELYASNTFQQRFELYYTKQGLIKAWLLNQGFDLRLLHAIMDLCFNHIKPVYYEKSEHGEKILVEEKPSLESILNIITHCQDFESAKQAIQDTQTYVPAQYQLFFFKLLAGEHGMTGSILARKLLMDAKLNPNTTQTSITKDDLEDLMNAIQVEAEIAADLEAENGTETDPENAKQISFKREFNQFLTQISAYTPDLAFAVPAKNTKNSKGEEKEIDPFSHKISDIYDPVQRALSLLQQPTAISDVAAYVKKTQALANKFGTPGAAILPKAKVRKLDELLTPLQYHGTQKLLRGVNAKMSQIKTRDRKLLKVDQAFQFPNETYAAQINKTVYSGVTLMMIFAQKSAPMEANVGLDRSWRHLLSPSQNFKPLIIADVSQNKKLNRQEVVIVEEVDENGKPFSAAQGRQGYFEALTDNLPKHTNKRTKQGGSVWEELSLNNLAHKAYFKAREV